ncbi:uncharacterized protein [Dysidea avara]|uniref:uncharacterized protein n=1 Tax=Dysidea avara TaxID=196820 RepID=UPI0033219407
MDEIKAEVARVQKDIRDVKVQKREKLQNLDFFVLDNSIRESTVGQLRSHTLENKIQIMEQVRKVGIKHIVIASFSHMTRVDDDFVKYLKDKGEDFSNFYSFSEVTEGVKDGRYDTETIPVSLQKNRDLSIPNTFFEMDLANEDVEWDTKFTVDDMCQMIYKWMKWTYDNITKDARILFNFRDLPFCMTVAPDRLLYVVRFLSKLPVEHRPFALCFEDPFGEYLPEELEAWTASMRRTMAANGWNDGKILVHIHQKWDLQTASQLDCLTGGADGVWASLCEEGAALGHACSAITMMNLIRLGNTKVLENYNCTELRNAAKEVTRITTGREPHPKQVLYGERATDLVFGFLGIGDFDMAKFFGCEAPNRITTLATTDMIIDRMEHLYDKSPHFTEEIAMKMKEQMLLDVRNGRKEEYNSAAGLAILFDRSGGKLTEKMADAIAQVEVKSSYHKQLIDEIREEWDRWDKRDKEQNDGCLQFDNFYHGFMQPYFGCYRCVTTKKALRALDIDKDNYVDWKEFLVYIKWALRQYPNVENVDSLMSIVFEKGLMPAMRDERAKSKAFNRIKY